MKRKIYLTEQGRDELQAELAHLTSKRRTVAEHIKIAREFGDLTENAEYLSARQDQERIAERMAEIKAILQNASIIHKAQTGQVQTVRLGSTVELRHTSGESKSFQVVGTIEANPLAGKISDESPLGQVLLNKSVGDKVDLKTTSDTASYTITNIS